MTKDEALHLALEALKTKSFDLHSEWGGPFNGETKLKQLQDKAITAIKSALEAKGEPVALAWAEGYRMGVTDERTSEANIGIAGFNAKVEPARENPYINTPSQQEAKDEPVQVSPLQFVEMVIDKEDCIGKPIIWAEWPNKENT